MTKQLFTNNAYGQLAAGINASVTSLTLGSGEGDLFPNPQAGEYFLITVTDSSNNREIMQCTARSTNTLTVVRAQEGTTARTFATSDRVELRPTAGTMQKFIQSGPGDVDIERGGDAETDRYFSVYTGTEKRWSWGADDAAEGGSEAGSDFEVVRYDDDGVEVDSPVTINRASGVVDFAFVPTIGGTRQIDAYDDETTTVFNQTSAPTGWTKLTTHNNKALRLVSGTVGSGGTKSFSDTFGDVTIATANLPAHSHAAGSLTTGNAGGHSHSYDQRDVGGTGAPGGGSQRYGSAGTTTRATTSEPAHTHTVLGSTAETGGGTPLDFNLQYVDVVLAQKDAM